MTQTTCPNCGRSLSLKGFANHVRACEPPKADKICTCTWNTVKYPEVFIEIVDPFCPTHGWAATPLTTEDEDYEDDAEDKERKMPW